MMAHNHGIRNRNSGGVRSHLLRPPVLTHGDGGMSKYRIRRDGAVPLVICMSGMQSNTKNAGPNKQNARLPCLRLTNNTLRPRCKQQN